MKKTLLVVFNGEEMCFIHALLNALDMHEKSYQVKIIMEGVSTALLPRLEKNGHFLHPLWEKVKANGLIEGVCKACSNKMGTLKVAEEIGLSLLSDMSGHPSLARYIDEGYNIIAF